MCEVDGNVRERFDELVGKIAKSMGSNFQRVEHDLSLPNDSFYLSNTVFLTIRCFEEGLDCRTLEVVAKRASSVEAVQRMLNADLQFHNEILFYRCYAKGDGNYPKCIYIEEKPPYDSIIVLENVSTQGYRVHERKYDVPMDDVIVAMKEIARFHAKGYIMREKQPDEFFNVVKNIKEARYQENNEKYEKFINYLAPRAVRYLRNEGYDSLVCEKMENYLGDAYRNVMTKAVVGVEPLATLCHGDFTINNVLFKRDGPLVDVILIDFALITYSSPAIDISTFLSLSCFEGMKRDNFDKIFRAYHTELVKHLTQAEIGHLERFSYEAMFQDYKRHALFGYVIATFFLATLMDEAIDTAELMELDLEVIMKLKIDEGGDKISRILADMLLDLKECGCLDHVL